MLLGYRVIGVAKEKKKSKKAATILDIAAATKVSPMTVSRVLNNRGGASEETRNRILSAAQRLNYHPNSVAQSLKSNRSKTVGIVVPDVENPYFASFLRGAELAARPAGYMLLCCNVIEDPEREAEMLGLLLERRVDGLINCSGRLESGRLLPLIEKFKAAVLVNRSARENQAGTIEVDTAAGFEQIVSFLVSSNRHRLAYIAGPSAAVGDQERRKGIETAMRREGLRLVYSDSTTPDFRGGSQAADRLLPAIGNIDAIMCYNDLIAIGLLRRLHQEGIAVPEQVAVTGCDDVAVASLLSPAITTLKIPSEDIGCMAMHMLLARIEGRDAPQKIVIQPELVIRNTTPQKADLRANAQKP